MKKKIITVTVLVFFMATLSATPVAGQWQNVKVIGHGGLVVNEGSSIYFGNSCYFWIKAEGISGPQLQPWTGSGLWLDRTIGLKVILTVESGLCWLNSYWCPAGGLGDYVALRGKADFFIGNMYLGTSDFVMHLWDGPHGVDNVGIWSLGEPYYFVWVYPPESLIAGQIAVCNLWEVTV